MREYACGRLNEAARHLIECRKRPVLGCSYYSKSPLQKIYPNNFSDGNVFSDNVASIRALKQDKIELQRGEFPGMQFKGCRSAFTFARILANGDVQLCHKKTIGNIYEGGFEEIWFGQKAHDFRRKLMEGTDICESCSFWLFCLNQRALDINDSSTFFGGIFRDHNLIEEGYKSFNIVSIHGDLYGLAQSEGRLDINKVGTKGYRCVTGDSVGDVKGRIDKFCAEQKKLGPEDKGYEGFARHSETVVSPKVLEIDLTNYCNLRCRICHAGARPTPKNRVQRFDLAWLENLKGISDCLAKLGGVYEPTIHPHFIDIVKFFSDEGCEIELVTNATVINDGLALELAKCNVTNVTLSLDSTDKSTYEYIRRGADFDVVKKNILGLCKALRGKSAYFRINMVLTRSNVGQLKDMIDFAEEHGIDFVSFITMQLRDFDDQELALESLYPIRNILLEKLDEAAEYVLANSMRPAIESRHYYRTALREKYPNNFEGNVIVSDNSQSRFAPYRGNILQLGSHPQLNGDCISPFTYAYMHPTGEAELCRMFSIGSVSDQSLGDIWRGAKAETVREGIMANQGICGRCPYYKTCLAPESSSEILNFDNPFNYVDRNVIRDFGNSNTSDLNAVISKVFESATGEKDDEPQIHSDPFGDALALEELKYQIDPASVRPKLLEEGYKGYNILRLRGAIYGLAQTEGKLDVNKTSVEGYRCFVADTVDEVKRLIDQAPSRTEREKRRLIEEGYKGYNIITVGGNFYGLAQSEGRLDIDKVGTNGYRCFVGNSIGQAKLLIDEAIGLKYANPAGSIQVD
jgi:radical SAM protein with 4Fe4S-binding SPASM domain